MSEPIKNDSKPRVVLLHPHCFSFRDMQFYAPLLDEFDVVAVTFLWRPETRTYEAVPQAALVSLDQIVGAVPTVQTVVDKVVRLRSENLYYFFGLEPLLQSAAIVECLETFHPYCYQAIQGKKKYSYKLAFSVHENIAFAHENLAIRRQIKRDAFTYGDAFFTLCEQGRNSLILEGAPAEKIHLSATGVDTTIYSPGEPDWAELGKLGLHRADVEKRPAFLFAGRLVWEKGIFDAVEAFGLLARQTPNVQLWVAGNGPEKAALLERARRAGVSDRVRFLGYASRAQMIALYRAATACLVPSIPTRKWQEQFGCVLIEAMACGCPVIAADSGAIREVLGGFGVLVAPNQHTALASAMSMVLSLPKMRADFRKAGRKHVVETYDNAVVANRIRAVYRHMLTGQSTPFASQSVPVAEANPRQGRTP